MTARILNMFPRAVCNPQTDGFSEWFKAFPRRAARQEAERAYIQAILAGHPPEALLLGAMCYAELHRKRGTEKQFLLLPASFLRGERFLDEEVLEHVPPTPEAIADSKDRADKLLKRGKYAVKYED